MKIGHDRRFWKGQQTDKQWLTTGSFLSAVESGEIAFITDTTIKLWGATKLSGLTFAFSPVHLDTEGPYKLGEDTIVRRRSTLADTVDKTIRSAEETMWIELGNCARRLKLRYSKDGGVVFLDCISAKNEHGGIYSVVPLVILLE